LRGLHPCRCTDGGEIRRGGGDSPSQISPEIWRATCRPCGAKNLKIGLSKLNTGMQACAARNAAGNKSQDENIMACPLPYGGHTYAIVTTWSTVRYFHIVAKHWKLECGPMPNLMVALPNIGGALCSTPQSLVDAHY